jgi:hypothetical protein
LFFLGIAIGITQRRSLMREIPTPTKSIVDGYLSEWQRLENYQLQERSLRRLFHSYCPNNTEIDDILLKVSVLNDFYSTNIYDTYSVAKHVLRLDFDARVTNGDLELVNELAKVQFGSSTRNCYSFASKYCAHHNPDHYPIYDSYVDKMLSHLKRADNFATFKKADLREYPLFVAVIEEFQRFYHLRNFSLRELDIFLWLTGKEYFAE